MGKVKPKPAHGQIWIFHGERYAITELEDNSLGCWMVLEENRELPSFYYPTDLLLGLDQWKYVGDVCSFKVGDRVVYNGYGREKLRQGRTARVYAPPKLARRGRQGEHWYLFVEWDDMDGAKGGSWASYFSLIDVMGGEESELDPQIEYRKVIVI